MIETDEAIKARIDAEWLDPGPGDRCPGARSQPLARQPGLGDGRLGQQPLSESM